MFILAFIGELFQELIQQGQLAILLAIIIVGGLALVLLGTRAGRFFLGVILLFIAFWSFTLGLSIFFFGLLIFGIILMATAFVGGDKKEEKVLYRDKPKPAEAKRYCRSCGRSIPVDSSYCSYCGFNPSHSDSGTNQKEMESSSYDNGDDEGISDELT